MRILKENKILTKYILPILMLPVVSLILEIGIKFLFQLGNFFKKTYNILEKNDDFCCIFQINLI